VIRPRGGAPGRSFRASARAIPRDGEGGKSSIKAESRNVSGDEIAAGKAQVSANRGNQGRLLNGLRTNFTGGGTRAGRALSFSRWLFTDSDPITSRYSSLAACEAAPRLHPCLTSPFDRQTIGRRAGQLMKKTSQSSEPSLEKRARARATGRRVIDRFLRAPLIKGRPPAVPLTEIITASLRAGGWHFIGVHDVSTLSIRWNRARSNKRRGSLNCREQIAKHPYAARPTRE
jgi:hypothetical protein